MPKTKLKASEIDVSRLVSMKEAHEILGKGYSRTQIQDKINKGILKQGVHYFRTNGNSGTIKIYVPAIIQHLIDINN